ncbi:MAG TPA: PQQ-dependent sugar dehydrogenase [Planctomycetaceae bacterium]|nr:PQQ-dependent sugar dehydrogenase [Planctomycetaceae bacterium]
MTFFRLLILLGLFVVASVASGGVLPGWRVETIAAVESGKFATSVVVDSRGTLYYTTTDGGVFRVDQAGSTLIKQLPTTAEGNTGLLGMALVDDRTAVVHYTNVPVTRHVLSTIDLGTGQERILALLVCDIGMPERPAPVEHHGGNPTVAPDGSIYFGIGDFGGGVIASLPEWNAGKIFRVTPDGLVTQFARGLRNPYDLAWDPELGRLFVGDNGALGGDEIHLVAEGDYCGWPFTYGNLPAIDGAVVPEYVFPETTAPTGVLRLSGANSYLRRGYLVGGFMNSSLSYFPDATRPAPWPDPLKLIDGGFGNVIDVAEGRDGALFVTTGVAVKRLLPPRRGDCNGDGLVDVQDVLALQRELSDGEHQPMTSAQDGAFAGSWGCDANADGVVSYEDTSVLARSIGRHRAVGRR